MLPERKTNPPASRDSLTEATPGGSWLIFCVHIVDRTRS